MIFIRLPRRNSHSAQRVGCMSVSGQHRQCSDRSVAILEIYVRRGFDPENNLNSSTEDGRCYGDCNDRHSSSRMIKTIRVDFIRWQSETNRTSKCKGTRKHPCQSRHRQGKEQSELFHENSIAFAQ